MLNQFKEFGQVFQSAVFTLRRSFVRLFFITFLYVFFLILLVVFYFDNPGVSQKIIFQSSYSVYKAVGFTLNVIAFLGFLLFKLTALNFLHRLEMSEAMSVPAAYREGLAKFADFLLIKLYYGVSVLLWSLALVIPGIYALFVYSFCDMGLIAEGKRGRDALRYSRELLKPAITFYVASWVYFGMILFVVFTSVIGILDSLIVVLQRKGQLATANLVNFIEVLFLTALVCFLVSFYYCLYRRVASKAG